jgi:hypothetical protein
MYLNLKKSRHPVTDPRIHRVYVYIPAVAQRDAVRRGVRPIGQSMAHR